MSESCLQQNDDHTFARSHGRGGRRRPIQRPSRMARTGTSSRYLSVSVARNRIRERVGPSVSRSNFIDSERRPRKPQTWWPDSYTGTEKTPGRSRHRNGQELNAGHKSYKPCIRTLPYSASPRDCEFATALCLDLPQAGAAGTAANSAEKALVLEQCERDLDLAIERLINLRLDPEHTAGEGAAPDVTVTDDEVHRAPAVAAPSGGGSNGDTRVEWIERLVGEMASAGDAGDARARAAVFLEEFVAAERDVALWQNGILKKAVLVQHRLDQEKEAAIMELRRQLAGCQERVKSLETDKYALSMYLRQGQQQGGSMTGRFHPEVF